MSYKNPKIIDDKSGLIVSQAIDKATATLGQGIVAFGAEEKRREEVRKKEQERRDKIYIGLANDMAKDSTLFNKGISKGSTELRNTLIPRNEMLLKRINDIQVQQQINGNRDPELSKEISNLRIQISDGNNFAESYMETATLLTKTMEDPQAFVLGEKTFTMIDGSQDESETIFNAIGGNPNYTRSFTSDLSVIVTNKTTGQSFKNTREEFEAKAKNLYITKKTNTADQETTSMKSKIYNKDGSANYLLLKGMPSATIIEESDGKGYVARYKTQILDTDTIDSLKKELRANTFAYVESFVGEQEQSLYLKDIGITGEKLKEYQNGNSNDRKELIKDSSDLLFESNSGVTKENDKYVIKTKIGNSTKITGGKDTSVIDLDIIKNFNPEGEIELTDFGLDNNTRLLLNGSMTQTEDISFDGKVITVTFRKASGDPEVKEGFVPAIVSNFDITTNLGRKTIIDRLGLNQKSEILLKNLLEKKIEKLEKYNTIDGKPMDGGSTNARLPFSVSENESLQNQFDAINS